jgi:hypothetical protein
MNEPIVMTFPCKGELFHFLSVWSFQDEKIIITCYHITWCYGITADNMLSSDGMMLSYNMLSFDNVVSFDTRHHVMLHVIIW